MKRKGNKMIYADERIDDLMSCYFKYIRECPHINMNDVYAHIVEMPASRFWVSEKRASTIVYAISRGDKLPSLRPLKRMMFEEIYRRCIKLQKRHPSLTLGQCCEIVVAEPAPRFYISAGSAKIIMSRIRRKWVRERMHKNLSRHYDK